MSQQCQEDVVLPNAEVAREQPVALFVVGLPDEGTFDWLDPFLKESKSYVELSDRAVHAIAQMSGIERCSHYVPLLAVLKSM
eukprot:4435131-Amphidinium_carterae.1